MYTLYIYIDILKHLYLYYVMLYIIYHNITILYFHIIYLLEFYWDKRP